GGGAQHITRNVWPKYKTASHLWAAFYICQDAKIDISAAIGFQKFVSTAQWLLGTASNLVPKGRRPGEAVLSLPNGWQVPPTYVLRSRTRSGVDLGGHFGAGMIVKWARSFRSRLLGAIRMIRCAHWLYANRRCYHGQEPTTSFPTLSIGSTRPHWTIRIASSTNIL